MNEPLSAAAFRSLVSELSTRISGGGIILNGDEVLALAAELKTTNA